MTRKFKREVGLVSSVQHDRFNKMSDFANENSNSEIIIATEGTGHENPETAKDLLARETAKAQEKQDVSAKLERSALESERQSNDLISLDDNPPNPSTPALGDANHVQEDPRPPISPISTQESTKLSSPVNSVPDHKFHQIKHPDPIENLIATPKQVESHHSSDENCESHIASPVTTNESLTPVAPSASSSDVETGATCSSSKSATSLQESAHHVKWIKWKDGKAAIITQNENGPCPLIAIMNVLILQGKVQLPSMVEIITSAQLMEYLGDCILEFAPKDITEGAQLNYEQNMHDAMAVLPKLQSGLDVNVKFTGVRDFEYTPECIIFDLLHIPLYHGWLVDPETPEIVAAVGLSSYNQLVEKIITNKASPKVELATEAFIAKTFLERTASQLTYHGLCELNLTIPQAEVCVLFRNNHFCTLYKEKDHLYQLVTDQGFLTESSVVWETLSTIDGDGEFVDSSFVLVPPRAASGNVDNNATVAPEQQLDQDYLVALSLQDEQEQALRREQAWEEYKAKQLGLTEPLTDEELARRLNDQEQMRSSQQPHQAQATGGGSSSDQQHRHGRHSPQQIPAPVKKKSDCTIL